MYMKNVLAAFYPLLITVMILPGKNCEHQAKQGVMPTEQNDGPYVLYKGEQVYIKYILNKEGSKIPKIDSFALLQKNDMAFTVAADEPGKMFSFLLKKKLQNEKSEYKKISKQFVLSDIEGNFKSFRKLLQANGVIDTGYNWTFGTGHLVLIGDFVDRGSQVTEVLWLIYSLEEKAKQAGGYVHFILGNHEIMNMSGDTRYVNEKYKENAALLGERYEDLFGENSELGRWLRTKNIMEKVGEMLYVHAGISSEINSMDIPIESINELVRPYYADSSYQYTDKRIDILYGDYGPFWYRGYYTGTTKASPEQIDSTVSKFNIRHIATGHTVVADTISAWYKGKVFDTDVHHAGGHSEALLIENGNYYRVNALGEKVQIQD